MHWKHSFSIQQSPPSQLCKVAVTIQCPFWKFHAYSQCHCVENTQQRGLIYTIVEPNTQQLHLANLIFFSLKETFFKDSYEQTKPSEWIVLRIPYVAMWGAQGPQSICGNMSSWESPFSLSFCDKQHELLWQLIQVWKYKIKLKMQTLLVRVLSSTPLFIDYLANVPSHGTQMP